MGFCKFIDKYELTKTHNAFLLYKTDVFELKPYFFYSYSKDTNTINVSFKMDFTLVLCNKINEFLGQSVPFDMSHMTFYLLVCIFVQSLRRRS